MDASWKMIGFIPVRDAEAARRFYEGVLGMRYVDQDPFAIVMEANGIMIRLVRMSAEFRPVPYTICGWEVSDIEAAAAELVTGGAELEHYPFVEDKSGIWTAPGGSRIAWFKDPDGNTLSISQHM